METDFDITYADLEQFQKENPKLTAYIPKNRLIYPILGNLMENFQITSKMIVNPKTNKQLTTEDQYVKLISIEVSTEFWGHLVGVVGIKSKNVNPQVVVLAENIRFKKIPLLTKLKWLFSK